MSSRYDEMESADEVQIRKELEGNSVFELVYTVDGRRHLSYAGVRYAAGLYGGIRVSDVSCKLNVDLDRYEATVYALNTRSAVQLPGLAEQNAYHMIEGKQVKDGFARRTAVSKATRNALLAVIPVDFIQRVIDNLRDKDAKDVGEVPLKICEESVKEYLKSMGVDANSVSIQKDKNRVFVTPTRFLGSITWTMIENAIDKIPEATWVTKNNRWEIPV